MISWMKHLIKILSAEHLAKTAMEQELLKLNLIKELNAKNATYSFIRLNALFALEDWKKVPKNGWS